MASMLVALATALLGWAHGILTGSDAVSLVQRWQPSALRTATGQVFRNSALVREYTRSRLALETPGAFSVVAADGDALCVTCTAHDDATHCVQRPTSERAIDTGSDRLASPHVPESLPAMGRPLILQMDAKIYLRYDIPTKW